MDYTKIITVEPGKRGGKACVRVMKMAVVDVLESLAGGITSDEILDDFPESTVEDIRACLAHAADCERKPMTTPQ